MSHTLFAMQNLFHYSFMSKICVCEISFFSFQNIELNRKSNLSAANMYIIYLLYPVTKLNSENVLLVLTFWISTPYERGGECPSKTVTM